MNGMTQREPVSSKIRFALRGMKLSRQQPEIVVPQKPVVVPHTHWLTDLVDQSMGCDERPNGCEE